LESFITVGINHESLALNLSHSKAYAVSKGLPLIRWRKQLKGKMSARLIKSPELRSNLYNDPEHEEQLHQYFVEDISAIILSNKNTSRGIVNGTDVKLYGLWYKDDSDRYEYEEMRAAAEPGEIITLSKAPDAVLVEISETTAVEWEKSCTLIDGKHIIPIFMDHSCYSDYYTEDKSKKKLGYNQFPYDFGGVRTGYKIQGATTPRLTCNFNARPKGCRTNLNLRNIFVSISRVKSIDHFRLVPFLNGDISTIDYMKKLSMDPKVRILPRCYNDAGEWTATTDDIVRWFDEFGVQWRPKATKKHPLKLQEIDILRNYPNFVEERKKEKRNVERDRIKKPFREKLNDGGQFSIQETSILERDDELLRSIRLNDNGRVNSTPLQQNSHFQDSSTQSEDATGKCVHRRKKNKITHCSEEVEGFDVFCTNRVIGETPQLKKRNRAVLNSTALNFEEQKVLM